MENTSAPDSAQVLPEKPPPYNDSCAAVNLATEVNGWKSKFAAMLALESDSKTICFEDYLETLPWDGDSKNHFKAYKAFLRGASLGIPPEEAMDAVAKKIEAAGGMVDPTDLHNQQVSAIEYIRGVKSGTNSKPPACARLSFSPERLQAVASRVEIIKPVEFICQRSVWETATITPEKFLNLLYQNGEHVVVFTVQNSQGQAVFHVGDEKCDELPLHGPEGVWYLIQPVDGQRRINRDGNMSCRSEASVMRWPHLLLESDNADPEQWCRLLIQLPLKIVAIYTSGGRSVHAIVRIDATSKADWDESKITFAKHLVPLGADLKAMTAVRLSRLPQCRRGESLQKLLYLNPDADGTPILNLPTRNDGQMNGGAAHG